MRLFCHGKSIYFRDLNLGSPTSLLYSCGPLLVNLSSFITFWSKVSLMMLIFGTECVWDALPLAEHSLVFWYKPHSSWLNKVLNCLQQIVQPPRWVQGAADLKLMQTIPIIQSQICSSACISGVFTVAAELIQPSESLNVSLRDV